MPAPDDDDEVIGEDRDEEAIEPQGSPANVSLTPDQVRNSPEYRALAKQARTDARTKGNLAAQLAQSREREEASRAAAEAQVAASRDEQIRSVLGDQGVERWSEIAELSASDPVAAAKAFRDFGEELAQSALAYRDAEAAAAQAAAATKGTTVPTPSGTPPPPSLGRSVGANVPLGHPAQEDQWDEVIGTSRRTVDEVIARNQDPLQRNRVTMKDRANAVISYLAGGYAAKYKEREERDRGRPAR